MRKKVSLDCSLWNREARPEWTGSATGRQPLESPDPRAMPSLAWACMNQPSCRSIARISSSTDDNAGTDPRSIGITSSDAVFHGLVLLRQTILALSLLSCDQAQRIHRLVKRGNKASLQPPTPTRTSVTHQVARDNTELSIQNLTRRLPVQWGSIRRVLSQTTRAGLQPGGW